MFRTLRSNERRMLPVLTSEGYDDSLVEEGAHAFLIDGLTKAACAASSVANRSSQTVDVPCSFSTSSDQPGSFPTG
jgi:hypothetical protein